MPSKNGPYLEEDFGGSSLGGRQYVVKDVNESHVLDFKNGAAVPLIERDPDVAVRIATDLSNDDTAYLALVAEHYFGHAYKGNRDAAISLSLAVIATLEAASFASDPEIFFAIAKLRTIATLLS